MEKDNRPRAIKICNKGCIYFIRPDAEWDGDCEIDNDVTEITYCDDYMKGKR